MAQNVREIMTSNPITLQATASVAEAASAMRDYDMGDVLVADGDRLRGIVTDRDIVVGAVAEARDLATTPISELCSGELTTLSPTDTVGDAVRVMRDKAVRCVPVVEGSRPVGIVALGDLAIVRDERSALAGISVAKPNR